MTTSPRWRSVLASAATAAALFAAPLAGAGAAHATDDPYPHPTKTAYPPKPPKPHKPHHGEGEEHGRPHHDEDPEHGRPHHGEDSEHGKQEDEEDSEHGKQEHRKQEHGKQEDGKQEDGKAGQKKPHLANTGDDNKKELALGGVAAGLVAAGVGTMLVSRRRRNS